MSRDVDRPALAAIAVVSFALANVVHEGVGHGGACQILKIPRSVLWLVAGAAIVLLFVGVLGPGIRF